MADMSIKRKLCKCEEYKARPSLRGAERLLLQKAEIELCVANHEKKIRQESGWQVPLGVSLSLLPTCFIVNNFYDPFKNGVIEHFFYFLAICSLIWLAIAAARAFPVQGATEAFLNEIFSKMLNKPDRTALFIIKRVRNDEVQLLVLRKETWDCYFLPYVNVLVDGQLNNENIDSIKREICNQLGVNPIDVSAQYLENFSYKSEKYAEPKNVVMEFNYEILHLRAISAVAAQRVCRDSFDVGDRSFEWKTLNELEGDTLTVRNNRDVLRNLRDNYSDLILNTASFGGDRKSVV